MWYLYLHLFISITIDIYIHTHTYMHDGTEVGLQLWVHKTQSSFCYYVSIIVLFSIWTTINLLLPQPMFNGIYISHKKFYLVIYDNIDRSRGYYVKWNESNREWQIPYYFIYMKNLKRKSKQTNWNENKLINTENKHGCWQRGRCWWEWMEKGKEIKK